MMLHNTLHRARILAALLVTLLPALSACNSKDDDDDTDTLQTPVSDVAVNAFSLKSNTKVLAGLDSVYFSIDLKKGVIFNADSLPKGTDVTKLVPEITFPDHVTGASIEMTGGKVRTGTVDYRRTPGDSIDFSGKVVLTLTSEAGNSRSYDLKVNVHEMEPDSLCWGSTALSHLPARMNAPRNQRTVQTEDKVMCLIEESDGSFTLSSTSHPETGTWERKALALPFTPRTRSFTATSKTLYILDTAGNLHSSTDGLTWTKTADGWSGILGAYGSELLGLRASDGKYSIVSLSGRFPEVRLEGAMAGFPIEDYSNMYCYRSQWMQSPIAILLGGVTAAGELSDTVWGFDGNSWVALSQGALPALRGAALIPYVSYVRTGSIHDYNEFSTLLVAGGLTAEGDFNSSLYLSYNNGITFNKGTGLMQMPSYIPGMWEADGIVSTTPRQTTISYSSWSEMPATEIQPWYRVQTEIDGSTVKWECPYIYLFGGLDASGQLYNTVWRGVINRLTFTPII